MKRYPKVITREELEKLHTKQLLAYLKRLHQCEESFEGSDWDENRDLTDEVMIHFKQTEKWKFAYRTVKSILSGREHVERKRKK